MEPLLKAIDIISHGNQSGFARALNEFLVLQQPQAITPQQIWNCLNRGDAIDPKYCHGIETLTKGEVTRQMLCPNDWQIIWPDLLPKTKGRRRSDKLIEGKPIDGATVRETRTKNRKLITDMNRSID